MCPSRTVRILSFVLGIALLGGRTASAEAASTAWVGDEHAAVRLLTAADAVPGGSEIEAGLEFRFAPDWHGYWRTPGDAGIPPVIDWSGTTNLAGATVSWPAPKRLVIEGLQNSVYEGRVVLPVRLAFATPRLADDGASAAIHATVDYAACSNVCVPFHADVTLPIPRGATGAMPEASEISDARRAVPRQPETAGVEVLGQSSSGSGPDRRLVVRLRSGTLPFDHPDLFVEGVGSGIPPAPTVEFGEDRHVATLTVSLGEVDAGATTPTLTLVDGSRSAEFRGPSLAPIGSEAAIWPALVSALLGGLILNLMPCVLPVLSIKLIGLTRQSGAGRRATRVGFAMTALGIVTSFLLIAGALVGLKWSGASLGWGIQFQQPWFLAAMATVTVVFAASLFDWVHFGVPQVATGIDASRRGGLRRWTEPFLTGAFATLLATPCSAPFVGTAVAFALSGSPFDILAIFLCLGFGMALPFLAAALSPGVAGWLPRPGPWMITLRRVLGILLLGTAAWLLSILWTVVGGPAMGATGLLLASLLAVLWFDASRSRADRRWPRRAATALGLLAVAAAVSIPPVRSGRSTGVDDGVAFDPATLDRLVAEGKTVLVDVSASWCLTCKVNELAALETVAVRSRLTRPDTILMRADWSRPDPVIAHFIQSFGRFGIPMDVAYGPRNPAGQSLPELLTAGTVVAALDRVSAEGERLVGDVGHRESTP